MKTTLAGGLCAVLLGAVMLGRTVNAAASCESLAATALGGTTITMAETVAAGAFNPPSSGGPAPRGFTNLPSFCRVVATLKPSSDSDIQVEVWLTTSGWNGKFQAVGNGGWAGTISYPALGEAIRRGYASASTDTGHRGANGSFALGHPEKLIDYAHRSEHEMTVTAKKLVAAFYGEPPRQSYWNGCSVGGRQGIKEAQRYPDDFDGIVAGAPATNWTGRAIHSVWVNHAVHRDEASFIPPSKFPVIHEAVLAKCDANDGVKDGVLEDPTRCRFDPKVLECKGADEPSCLTPAQVEAVRKIYTPVTSPRTKQVIFPAHEPGSELGWTTMAGQKPFGIGLDHFRYVVFQDPNWDGSTFDFDRDAVRTEQTDGGLINALDPNLNPFFARGGKLLQYHGWSDPQISPGSSVAYYKSVVDKLGGAAKVSGSYRLFMVPGMAHCGGGDGTATFDMIGALEQWVEHGKAPEQIAASRVRDGKVDRTRPLCPYPQVATYTGSGSTDEAASFVCKAP